MYSVHDHISQRPRNCLPASTPLLMQDCVLHTIHEQLSADLCGYYPYETHSNYLRVVDTHLLPENGVTHSLLQQHAFAVTNDTVRPTCRGIEGRTETGCLPIARRGAGSSSSSSSASSSPSIIYKCNFSSDDSRRATYLPLTQHILEGVKEDRDRNRIQFNPNRNKRNTNKLATNCKVCLPPLPT